MSMALKTRWKSCRKGAKVPWTSFVTALKLGPKVHAFQLLGRSAPKRFMWKIAQKLLGFWALGMLFGQLHQMTEIYGLYVCATYFSNIFSKWDDYLASGTAGCLLHSWQLLRMFAELGLPRPRCPAKRRCAKRKASDERRGWERQRSRCAGEVDLRLASESLGIWESSKILGMEKSGKINSHW